jgi:GT2 family glycosyltransferase
MVFKSDQGTMNAIDLSIVIVNWNTRQLLLDCVASIYQTVHRPSFEIFVVDNGSTDGSVEAVSRAHSAVRIIANTTNLGFARANNLALMKMSGRYAVLLNSDTILKESALDAMFDFMEGHPGAGMCGPQLLNVDDSRQNSVGHFPTLVTEFMSKKIIRMLFPEAYRRVYTSRNTAFEGPAEVDYIVGACMMARKEAMDEAGMLDDDYFFLYEEVDWCFRMKKSGWQVYHLPDAAVYHLVGQSMKEINLRARVESWRSRYLFFKKNYHLSPLAWYGLLLLGFFQNAYQFAVYSLLNMATLFSLKRLRRRWFMFVYLLVWHVRGCPVSMGIPR